ncbi:MAG: family 20 glycosylhydrolase [Bacteroidota bacterium]|nr:family 20 glycosylhydrolase [Bacteroidota bacterium]MDP4206687.1 family 20 glycosylhydrolase [Bacteroidota bacterium]
MKRIGKVMMLFAAILLASSSFNLLRAADATRIRIVPQPEKVTPLKGEFIIKSSTVFYAPASELNGVVDFFGKKLEAAAGLKLKATAEKPAKNFIAVELDPSVKNDEGYVLMVTPESITVKGSTAHGVFYGLQTVLQLLPAEIESGSAVKSVKWSVPCVEVVDAPRFTWRGMHLDVCRHFFDVDFIKKQLDVMAMYKMNTFHWHLTEDQGWRIEIKKYPLLTEKGSKRIEGEGNETGGYYTQDQIREIVKYAADRYIDVVPEIEMPGHALGALTAYPQFSCTGGPFKVRNLWGVEPDVYCAGKEETFKFIEDVINEVVTLFPGKYFHIGGDECPKDRWKICPDCQKRIHDEGLKNEAELQSYFVKRIEKILSAKGKKMMGWDEILEGGLAPSASVMSWRGEEGGIEAANQGHDVVMTPGNWVYLDHYQGDSKVEPVGIGGYTTLEETYGYDPIPHKISADKQHHILGTQGNVWSEYMYTPAAAEHRIYPRIIAIAEVDWTQKENKDFTQFVGRMNNQYKRLDCHNINYAIPMPEGPGNQIAFIDTVSLKFKTTRPVKMVYTLDGKEPGLNSAVYSTPLNFNKTTTLKIRSVLPTGDMSPVRTILVEKQQYVLPVNVKTSAGLKMQSAKGQFIRVAELDKVSNWETKLVPVLAQKFSCEDPSAHIFTGFIDIPTDGVYFFNSDVDQVWIDAKLIVNNDGEVKRFSRHDGSIALAKGKHEFKVVYLNNIVGGWPAEWNGIKVNFRKADKPEFEKIPDYILSH